MRGTWGKVCGTWGKVSGTWLEDYGTCVVMPSFWPPSPPLTPPPSRKDGEIGDGLIQTENLAGPSDVTYQGFGVRDIYLIICP